MIYAPAALHREAWRALLADQPSLVIGGLLAAAAHLAAFPQTDRPTTLLIDLPAPQPDAIKALKDSRPALGLLVLVLAYDLAEIIPLLKAGATGCISRDAAVSDLARAIIAAGRGELVLPQSIATQALLTLARGELIEPSPIEPFTDREVDVLRLLGQGLTNKDIAQTLILSVRTVDAHLRSIFAKLGVHSRTEAALWMVKHGEYLEK
ncbi:Transcriptional regulatory protein LnrK [Thermoflexales bacterium]|nr:Transcriptional regulatory protein LnrK [Thermoflexales bacterium]